jgi:hypothetical protein
MKIRVNKFLEHGAAIIAGSISAVAVTTLSQYTGLTPEQHAAFGSGFGVLFARYGMDKLKSTQTEESIFQFTSNKPKMR